jgi:DNA-binding GntR family transcriptional regulator
LIYFWEIRRLTLLTVTNAPSIGAVNRVAAGLREDIIAGRLSPLQQLPLRKIAVQFGVSFIPVREALRSLEAEGLVERRNTRIAIVAPLSSGELDTICQLCRLIEPDTRAHAAQQIKSRTLDQLETRLVQGPTQVESLEDDHYARNHAFHLELVRPGATTWELRILERLWRALERYVRASAQRVRPDSALAPLTEPESRRELLTTYRTRNPNAIRQATLRHIELQEQTARHGLH